MNDTADMLTNLNNNLNYDLVNLSPYIFENDDSPNPSTDVNIDSKFYDDDSFVRKFAGCSGPIFLSINIQCLMSKIENLKNFIINLTNRNLPIVVIAIQEVWSLQHAELVNIPGFNFVYKLRSIGRGGGVGFYLRDDLQYKILDIYPFVNFQFENIIVETCINKKKYYLCNIYRSPNSNTNESQRDLIENYNNRLDDLLPILSKPNFKTLIFSDSNINLLKLNTSQLTAEYLDTCHSNGFLLTNLKATRLTQNSSSLIDHIMSNDTSNDFVSGTIIHDLSDHFPIFYNCNDVLCPSNIKIQSSRNLTHDKLLRFRETLANLRWNSVLGEGEVNASLNNFLDIFLTLFEAHFPLTQRKFNRNRDKLNEFMTLGLMISRKTENLLYKKQLADPTHANVHAFKIYRNIYNSVLRKSKKMYYEDIVSKFKSKPKKLWEVLNKVNGKERKGNCIKEIFNGDNLTCNDLEMAQTFNNYFSSIGSEILASVEHTNVDPLSYVPDNPDTPLFTINNTGPVHVIDVVKSMPSKSSNDCNQVSIKLIKYVIYEIAVPLSHIFQLSIQSGIFPERFKASRVVPVFKQGDPKNCDNYRPIALVNSFSKILEKMVATDFFNHLDLNNLLYKHQYGFQRGKSTEHNLLQVVNYIGSALNEGKWCIGIFLDLKKAFDTVQHDILLRKLQKFGVTGSALAWFTSYLSNRSQCVDINGTLSDFKQILMSVLQGSSLGPILFLCFINDIFYCTNLSMFLFADDTNALSQHDNLMTLIDFINVELQKLATWFKANKLVINASKTKYMIFRTKNRNVNLQNKEIVMNFNDVGTLERPELIVKLSRVFNDGDNDNQTYKLLGVIFDEYLSFNQHVSYVNGKLSKSLYLLNRAKHFLPKNALRMLYFATVHSHLTYCPIILSIASKTSLNKLIIMQKKAIRIISGVNTREHTAPLFLHYHILPFNLIVKYAKLILMHSVKFNLCPKSFFNVFNRVEPGDFVYELRYPNEFDVPRARLELFKRIPLYTLPLEWNNCGDLRFYQNPLTFKLILIETLFRTWAEENNLVGEHPQILA
jgi:Reverse transcriptase (RNA-dependent DNA polymerase)